MELDFVQFDFDYKSNLLGGVWLWFEFVVKLDFHG